MGPALAGFDSWKTLETFLDGIHLPRGLDGLLM